MAHFMPPALLQLFTPRPALEWKEAPPRQARPKLTGFAAHVKFFTPKDALPPIEKVETPRERKARLRLLKMEEHKKVLEERMKNWDPHTNPKATKDAYKTLFVARLHADVTEEDLRDEFERYGDVRDVKLIRDRQGKSRGYGFIEFESSQDLKDAFKYADGKSIKSRRILVDVERGRTVPGWKPRKLGNIMVLSHPPPPTYSTNRFPISLFFYFYIPCKLFFSYKTVPIYIKLFISKRTILKMYH